MGQTMKRNGAEASVNSASDPVWAFLKRRPPAEAIQALRSTEQLYRTRSDLSVGDPARNRKLAERLMLAAAQWSGS